MRATEHHPLPALGAVAWEQFRIAGAAMRWVWAAAGAYFTLVTATVILEAPDQVSVSTVMPYSVALPAAFMGAILPLALWRRENPSERAYFHSMPLGRFSNHLLRNGAGWVWAMIAVAAVYAWGMGLVVALRNARIGSAEPWQWMAPFACMTAAFLLAAAIATAFDHPAAIVMAVCFALTLTAMDIPAMVALGRFGALTMATGSRIVGNSDTLAVVPLSDWLIASALWIGLGTAALVTASAVRRDP